MSKGFVPIIILVGVLVMAVVAGGAYYLGRFQVSKPQLQKEIISPTPQPTSHTPLDETFNPDLIGANWKTYTNTKYGFTIKYPQDKRFEINEELKDTVFVAVPQSDYGVAISIYNNPELLALSEWFKEQDFSTTQINRQPLKYSDFTTKDKVVGGQAGLEISGPTPSYILTSSPDNERVFKISGYTLEENLFNQILSTFKFN